MKNVVLKNLIDKTNWDDGPWMTEADKEQWQDEETGLPCLFVRHREFGNLYGYVGVTKGHPMYGLNKDGVDCLDVHGGVTFMGKCIPAEREEPKVCHIVEDGEDDSVWWIGFDCAHSDDLLPRHRALVPQLLSLGRGEYRTVDYVKEECKNLAKQLYDMMT